MGKRRGHGEDDGEGDGEGGMRQLSHGWLKDIAGSLYL